MAIYFTSDNHFGHRRILEYTKRPYKTIPEMDEALIENWNKVVKKNEYIYVLGDFSFSNRERTKEIISRLNGIKILIIGNHDKDAKKSLELGFDQVFENHSIRIGDEQILLSHFPYHPMTDLNQDQRYLHKRIVNDGKTFLLHGHVHETYHIKDNMINVGVDVNNYTPVSHHKILSMIEKIRNPK
jgi:calcineurin-like phosphoesterase family protein